MLTEEKYQRLCHQVRTNDSTCIEELYDLYADALYGIIIRIVKTDEVANELLQDTFMKVWQRGQSYDPKLGRLYTWMMRIARNGAINHINSKSSRQAKNIQSDDNLVYLSDNYQSVKKLENFDMKGAVNRLELKYRSIVDLIYFQGYTQKEVSDQLNLPLGTVKSRIKIALRELKKFCDYRMSSAVGIIILIITLSL